MKIKYLKFNTYSKNFVLFGKKNSDFLKLKFDIKLRLKYDQHYEIRLSGNGSFTLAILSIKKGAEVILELR